MDSLKKREKKKTALYGYQADFSKDIWCESHWSLSGVSCCSKVSGGGLQTVAAAFSLCDCCV